MNYKRKKSKKSVRCTICTPYRWRGNSKDRRKVQDQRALQEDKENKYADDN